MYGYIVAISIYLSLFHIVINRKRHTAGYNISYSVLCLAFAGIVWFERIFPGTRHYSRIIMDTVLPFVIGMLGISLIGFARSIFQLSRFRLLLNVLVAVVAAIWLLMCTSYILTKQYLFIQIYFGVLVIGAIAATFCLLSEILRLNQYLTLKRLIFVTGYILLVFHGVISIVLVKIFSILPVTYTTFPGIIILPILFAYTMVDLITIDNSSIEKIQEKINRSISPDSKNKKKNAP